MKGVYGDDLAARVPAESEIRWHGAGHGLREAVRVELPGAGYPGSDIDKTATWAINVSEVWLDVLRERPINDLSERVQRSVPDATQETIDDDDEEVE
jgi:hypothetical protein